MFSTCPFVRLPVRSFVTNLRTLYFKNEWTDFNANWHKSSQGQQHERSGVQRSRSQEAEVMFGSMAKTSFSNLDPWVECRGTWWTTEMLSLKGWVHIVLTAATAFVGYATCWCTCLLLLLLIIITLWRLTKHKYDLTYELYAEMSSAAYCKVVVVFVIFLS